MERLPQGRKTYYAVKWMHETGVVGFWVAYDKSWHPRKILGIVKVNEYNKTVRLWLKNFSSVQRFVQIYFHLNISINSVLLCPPVETWVWLAVLTVPSVCPRRPSAKTTSLRSQKVSMGSRRGCPSSGIRLWWGLLRFIFFFLLF